ncbi:LysR family transcriptional regulator [Microbacterium murale]|uniref:LysR family transcriptional regulator n=1 Tax=Microbacterium murale TaxID=1081040 RepID=A0ABQ1RHG2_9MICO|nr:LysR family transcriptional regulator [Microbacterium murale]GGD70636.1 LysR family transcriptional regulator [Microbacterium murale]
MELRHLRYFAAVVEAGSISAAAAQLRLSQPSLSVAISRLETEVGTPLLERSTRGVEPTSAGRYLLGASSRVLSDVDEIASTLTRFGAGVAGTLTIAAVPVLMWRRIPELLRRYAAEAPDVEINLLDPPPWDAVDMLQQRTVDVAAVLVAEPKRFARRHASSFEVHDWGEVPLVAVLPPDLADAPDPFPLRSFDDRVLVLPHRTAAVPSLPEAVDAALRRHGVTPSRIRTVETIQASLPLIEAGLAWGILPDPDRASLTRFNVTMRRLDPDPKGLQALALARQGAMQYPAQARLLALIDETG